MAPESTWRRRVVVAALLGLAVGAVVGPSVNALPGFSDHTGPTEMEVTTFERVETGCVDEMAEYGGGSTGGGGHTRIGTVATADVDADLSARVERTSPAGADLSTFRVHVDSHDAGPANETCRTAVRYRITLTPDGGSGEGLLPDAHGTRIVWIENGEYVGCSGSYTSPLDGGCHPIDGTGRTWANASAG